MVTTTTINLLPQLNFLQTVKYKELKMQQKLVRSFQHLNRSSLSLTTNREFKNICQPFVNHFFRDGLLYKKVQDLPQKEHGFRTPTRTNQKEPKLGINSGFAQENSQRDGRKILQ